MRRYLIVVLGLAAVVLGTVLTLNLKLGARALGSVDGTRVASRWQEETKGVTYAPPVGNTRPFKTLRLADRLSSINALVLGSSTVMGLTASLFPAHWQVYNMAVTGNVTAAIAGEAEYVDKHYSPPVRFLLVGLDWSVGNLYAGDPVHEQDLAADLYTHAYSEHPVSLLARMEDALAWPRVVALGAVLRGAMRSGAPLDDLSRTLAEPGGRAYTCADGSPARDFDLVNRGLCRGYRYDGSWTFANDSRLTAAQAATLAAAAAAPSSKYTQFLCTTDGMPNAAYLRQLSATAQHIKARGGSVIFLLPPLVPGLEAALMSQPRWKSCLEHTKNALDIWARRSVVTVIDAGASERAGCTPQEFVDEHHAYPECNARILGPFFKKWAAGEIVPGLYAAGAP